MPARAPSQLFARYLLIVLAGIALITGGIYWNLYGYSKLFQDFNTFYAAAGHAATGDYAGIYGIASIKALESSSTLKDFSYYLNPPTGLLLLYPLAFLPHIPALILWSAAQLLLLLAVSRTRYLQQLFAPQTNPALNTTLLLAISLLAFILQNLLFGQMAGFCTVCFLLTLAWRKTHPLLAGLMLGLLSIKPQLGVLLPLLLLLERNWKALGIAFLTAALLILLSLLLFGPGLWQDYREMLVLRSRFLMRDQDLLFVLFLSPYGALRNLGASATFALGLQMLITLSLVGILYKWRADTPRTEAQVLVMLTLTTCLITPYALIYDMVLLALPCAFFLRRIEENYAKIQELITIALLAPLPLFAVVLQISHIPYCVIAIGFAFGVASRLPFTERQN